MPTTASITLSRLAASRPVTAVTRLRAAVAAFARATVALETCPANTPERVRLALTSDPMSSDPHVAARRRAWRRSLLVPLRVLRASQPFNVVATTVVRSLTSAVGWRPGWVEKHLHRVGWVHCALPNGRTLTLKGRGDDWVSNLVFWNGWAGYEPETVPLFYRLATQSRVTLDVGAYVGFFALLASHANPSGQVYAFEALPAVHARLQRNVAANQLRNVECVPSAVGDRDGTAEFFHVARASIPCSSSLSFEFMQATGDLRRTVVPVLTLDRFVEERRLARVDLVKIDTETTEPDVLAGMAATLERDHPDVVCEVLAGRGSESRLDALIRRVGYQAFLLTDEGPALKERVEGHPRWLNYLFTVRPPDEVETLGREALRMGRAAA